MDGFKNDEVPELSNKIPLTENAEKQLDAGIEADPTNAAEGGSVVPTGPSVLHVRLLSASEVSQLLKKRGGETDNNDEEPNKKPKMEDSEVKGVAAVPSQPEGEASNVEELKELELTTPSGSPEAGDTPPATPEGGQSPAPIKVDVHEQEDSADIIYQSEEEDAAGGEQNQEVADAALSKPEVEASKKEQDQEQD